MGVNKLSIFVGLFLMAFVAHAEDYYSPDDPVPSDAIRTTLRIDERARSIDDREISIDSDAASIDDSDFGIESGDLGVRDSDYGLDDEGSEIGDGGLKISEDSLEIRIEISSDVLFDFDRWGIRPDAAGVLKEVGDILKEHSGKAVQLVGHTDSKGSNQYNLDLSIKRAKSVRAWLVHREGVQFNRFSTNGRGESQPVAPNTLNDGRDNPKGRQQNRRVEISVVK